MKNIKNVLNFQVTHEEDPRQQNDIIIYLLFS